jgi:hypothetical protein
MKENRKPGKGQEVLLIWNIGYMKGISQRCGEKE